MVRATQPVFSAKVAGEKTTHYLENYDTNFLVTQVKKRGSLLTMLPLINKGYYKMGDEIIEISFDDRMLRNKIGAKDKE